MIVIPPITVTSGMLTSSIPEPDPSVGEVLWNAATSYSIGNQVVRTSTHKVYECLIAGIDTTIPENIPSRWIEVRPTNRWAMFDTSRSSISTSSTDITLTITPGIRFNSLGLVGLNAEEVEVTITSPTLGEVFHSIDTLYTRNTNRWYKYFFGEFRRRSQLLKSQLPPVSNSVITIVVRGASSRQIGGIIIGSSQFLGDIQVSPTIEILNFSRVDRDSYGHAVLVPRKTVPRTVQKTFISKNYINKITDTRTSLNAVPSLWAGFSDDTQDYFEPLLIFGIYKEFSINMDYPDHAVISLQLEEI